jgi:hypothetical protein
MKFMGVGWGLFKQIGGGLMNKKVKVVVKELEETVKGFTQVKRGEETITVFREPQRHCILSYGWAV